jgi:Protein of unknown function (DUF3987)
MMNGHDTVAVAALEQATRQVLAAPPDTLGNILHDSAGHLAAIGIQTADIVRELREAAKQRGVSGGRVYDTINAGIREARKHPEVFSEQDDDECREVDLAGEPSPDLGGDLLPEIRAARLAFYGDGGLASCRRVVRGAAPGKELAVLELQTREALSLARKVEINEIDVIDIFDNLAGAQGITDEYGTDAVQAALARARSAKPIPEPQALSRPQVIAGDDGPIPLIPELAPPAAYPVGALGPVLGEAAVSIARKVQCPIEISAQSVLAVASLAAQAHADVLMPFGQTRPLSLSLCSIASSGDRKTSADYEALEPVRHREKELGDQYSQELESTRIAVAAWQGEKKAIEGNKKLDYESRKIALTRLGREPEQPLHPILTATEPTIEGLAKAWVNAPASLGLFSAEGGQFVGGHGMSPDHRLKTASALSELWDGRPIKRVRAGDGVTILNGRRLALHIMIQPNAALTFFADPLLRDQGLLSRVLVASPPTLAGQRFFQSPSNHDDSAIRAYSATIGRLLERPWPLAEGRRNELAPRILRMSAAAQEVWTEFYNSIEARSGPGRELAAIRDVAGKAGEHAARIAGVLSIVADPAAHEISGEIMRDAVALTDWYVTEALRLAAAALTDPRIARAQRLFDWLRSREDIPPEGFSVRYVTRYAPTDLRSKEAADSAIRVLVEHGQIVEASPKPRRWRLVESGKLEGQISSSSGGARS